MHRFALALALGFTALSAQAQTAPATAPATAEATAASDTVIEVRNDGTASEALDTGCVRETGTLTPKRDKKGCTGAAGQSYSREDIDRTGATDTADAVRALSPGARVRRGN